MKFFLCTLLCVMSARGMADMGPYKAWDPAAVIDSSKLIVLVERMEPRAEANVANKPGYPIGTIMELRVLQVSDGEKQDDGTILLFQPASSDRGWQYFDARKFVLFLCPVAKEQRAELAKLPKVAYPKIQKKFSEIHPADVIGHRRLLRNNGCLTTRSRMDRADRAAAC